MVGGIVIEVADIKDRPNSIYVDCVDPKSGRRADTCAIVVERNANSERIEIGDAIWWQGGNAMWTPKDSPAKECGHEHHYCCGKTGVDYDIKIPRIGYSGVLHPARM